MGDCVSRRKRVFLKLSALWNPRRKLGAGRDVFILIFILISTDLAQVCAHVTVYGHVCICVCGCVFTWVQVHMWMHVSVPVYMWYSCMWVSVYACLCVCVSGVYVCVQLGHVCMSMLVYVHVWSAHEPVKNGAKNGAWENHAHTHITHTYMHACVHRDPHTGILHVHTQS